MFAGPLEQGKKALGVAAQAWRRRVDGARKVGAKDGVVASSGEHRYRVEGYHDRKHNDVQN